MAEYRDKLLIVDGMGGDAITVKNPKLNERAATPLVILEAHDRIGEGIKLFYDNNPKTTTRMKVTGRKEVLEPLYSKLGLPSLVEIVDTPDVLPMDVDVTSKIDEGYDRYAPADTTIRRAYEIANGNPNACVVSIGNTIGLVHYAREILGMVGNVAVPCLLGKLPCRNQFFYTVDLGANPMPKAFDLFRYAVVTEAFLRAFAAKKDSRFSRPRVGLITYGTENIKASPQMKKANALLANWSKNVDTDFRFLGNVEPMNLASGEVELGVAPGDYGNLIIKVLEAFIPEAFNEFRDHVKKTPRGKIGGLLLKERAQSFREEKMSPEAYSGAYLLLVKGYAIKAHGTATAKSVRKALEIGEEYAGCGVLPSLERVALSIDIEKHCYQVLKEVIDKKTAKHTGK